MVLLRSGFSTAFARLDGPRRGLFHAIVVVVPPCRRRHLSGQWHLKERIPVRVGGSGSVNLDIWRHPQYQQQQQPHPDDERRTVAPSSIIVYLPPGRPFCPNNETDFDLEDNNNDNDTSSLLLPAAFNTLPASCLVASIDYRLSSGRSHQSQGQGQSRNHAGSRQYNHAYPQPIHDVSLAFSHLIASTVPSLLPPPGRHRSAPPPPSPPVILVGSRIGASLAAMLALTQPNAINAVVAVEPLVDWAGLDESAGEKQQQKKKRGGKKKGKSADDDDSLDDVSTTTAAAAARTLIDIRTNLFRSPSAYFDPFASPTLLLRAPGRDTPGTHAEALGLVEKDNEQQQLHQQHQQHQQHLFPDGDLWNEEEENAQVNPAHQQHVAPESGDETDAPDLVVPDGDDTSRISLHQTPIKRRKVLHRWPPNYPSTNASPLPPHFNIILVAPNATSNTLTEDNNTNNTELGIHALLHAQGSEFADLLKRACFFGRESGIAETRIRLTEIHDSHSADEQAVEAVHQFINPGAEQAMKP